MAKEKKEKLTAMLTLVVTPSTRARIDAAAETQQVPYAQVIRWAIEAWLNANAIPPVTANSNPTEVGE